jgi:prepilin-type N-terminal cleavage/methylation domain-containing protein
MRFISRVRRDERGMTMIELIVAAAICAVGTMATIGVIDNSRAVAVKAEKRDAMAHQAERELERLMELPFDNLAHPTVPAGPASFVSGNELMYDRSNTALTEQIVVSAANGQVQSTSSTWNDAQIKLSGNVYRFVSRVSANARRVTVVVSAGGENSPPDVLLSSIKTKPIL